MQKLEKGEIVTLDNNKEYLVYDVIQKNNKKYIYLSSNTDDIKDLEVLICEEKIENDNVILKLLTDKNEITEIANELVKGVED